MLDEMFYLPYFWYIKTDIFVLFLFLDIILSQIDLGGFGTLIVKKIK